MEGEREQGSDLVPVDTETRDPITGKFLKGKSGNPNGRPPSIRAKIGLNQALMEDFVRGRVPAKDVLKVVQAVFRDCHSSDHRVANSARKLVFEFFIQKPRDVEAVEDKGNSVVIRIENATFKAQHEPSVIEGEVTEVTDNG